MHDVTETDVSPKTIHNKQHRYSYLTMAGQNRLKLVGWPLCHVSTLRKRRVTVLMRCKLSWGLASLQDSHRSLVGRHEDLPTDATQQRRIERTCFKGTIFLGWALDIIAAIPSVKTHKLMDHTITFTTLAVLWRSKKATMNYNLPHSTTHVHVVSCNIMYLAFVGIWALW